MQAAAYINVNKTTFKHYLSLLAKKNEEIDLPTSEEYENLVATTWFISFEQIRRHDSLAADYLLFMACIDPKDVPLVLLPTASSYKERLNAIGVLDAYSFITKRPAESALDLHRLVHLATQKWLQEQEIINQWTQTALERLLEVFPDENYGNRGK